MKVKKDYEYSFIRQIGRGILDSELEILETLKQHVLERQSDANIDILCVEVNILSEKWQFTASNLTKDTMNYIKTMK